MSSGASRSIRSSGLPTRVRLIERVGNGSFGEVWLARDTREGIDVAVKFLEQGSDAPEAERFEREVRSLARLSGIRGIVGIRDLGVAPDGTPWLVTDYLAGGTLRFQLDVEAWVPWSTDAKAQVAVLFLPLASALAAAHELGVFHGDISPANVLFDDSSHPWLTDFGMSALSGSGLGADGVSGCTPAYAAPERLRGAQPGPRSDVYSLAATLWHVLSGEPRSSSDGQGPSEAEAADVDPLVGLLKASLDKAPGLRPSAAELVESLTRREIPSRRWRYRRADGEL